MKIGIVVAIKDTRYAALESSQTKQFFFFFKQPHVYYNYIINIAC